MAISKVKSIFSTYTLDDSTEEKNYHRVLFKPGVSVQARELTELQTNLQRQIDYHGQYTFVEGSRVTGGELALDVQYDYIKVESAFTNGDGVYTASGYINTIANTVGAKLTGANGVEAEVLQVISEAGVDLKTSSNKTGILDSGNTSDALTLFVKYTKGSGDTNANVFSIGETLVSSTLSTGTVANQHKLMVGGGTNTNNSGLDSTITNAVGQGSKITLNEGVYFLSGSFVYVAADELILEKYDRTPSNIIGLNITESVITSVNDTTLVDNATGFPNAAAPGASRYKIATTLIKEPLASPNSVYTNYLTLLRVEDGIVSKKVAPAAAVDTELTRRFAGRTFEESGNYSLNPFVLDIKEHLDNGSNQGFLTAGNGGSADKYVVGIEPNTAYVQGFRTENLSTQFITVDKPREDATAPMDFVSKPSATSALPIGNYIRVKLDTVSDSTGLPDIENFSEMALQDQSSTAHTALVDTVNDSPAFGNAVSTGRAVGVYTITDTGASGSICTSSTAGGGQGSGATFKITIDQSKKVTVEVTGGGTGYHVNNVFTVKGTALGGATTANDLTFAVAQLGVGRARVRAITAESDNILRLYLFDVTMTKGAFAQVDRVEQLSGTTGGSAANVFDAKLVAQIGAADGKIYDANDNSYVWKLPYDGIKKVESTGQPKPIYQIQKRLYVDDAGAADSTTFSNALDSDETLVSTSGIIVSIGSGAGGDVATATDGTASASSQNVTITHDLIADNSSVCAIITVQKTGAGQHKKSKTINTVTSGAYVFDGTNPLPLDKYDIYKLISVKLGAADGPDITNKFQLDNGQRANYYDEGNLIPISTIAAGTLYVTFMHYTHSTGEYLVRDSYPADNASTGHYLKDVPTLRLPNGDEVDLKDCVDFRPVKGTIGVHSNNFSSIADSTFNNDSTNSVNSPAIAPSSQFIMNAEIWLPRIDKLVLSRDGTYSILKGVSSEDPIPVEDPSDSMILGTLRVRAFAYDAKIDVLPTLNEYKRYTMKHIGEIDKRVKKLEYYTSLSLMEQETFNISLNEVTQSATGASGGTFTNTIERFKNGIFTDQFKGHANGNVEHPNYHCAIDRQHSVVRPKFDERNVNLVRKAGDTGVVQNRSVYTLPYESATFIDQPNATETEFINPYNMFTWNGSVRLSPDSDEWKDVDHRPDIIVNDDGQFDQMVNLIEEEGILGTVWNEWETDWTGVDRDVQTFSQGVSRTRPAWRGRTWTQAGTRTGTITTTTDTTGQSRTGLTSSIREDIITTESGNRVVETNFIPFMRSREIFFTAEMMKPNTRLYAFFNGVNVTTYCAEKTFQEFTDRTNVVEHTGKTSHDLTNSLITDASGRVEGSFYIPNNTGLRFKTGERTFKLTDSTTNNTTTLNDETTAAETVYRAMGLLETQQNTIINTKVATVVTNEVNDERVLTDRNVSEDSSVTWFDPLAQSILIQEKGGVFVTELDIFLNTADTDIPINISIREMQNGYPTQKIVPGSETILYPNSAAASTIAANTMVAGKRYKIKNITGVNFTTVGASSNTVGTVFRVPLETAGSTISNLAASGKVDEVNVIYTGAANSMLSNDASVATTAVFANPIYLSQDQEYAIVLISNSDIYKLFVTSPGKVDLTTNTMVDGNHYGGSFFMSQNASTWTADTFRDLKFKLKKAVFSTTSSITFVNDQIPPKQLESDPFFICTASANNSAVLRVSHPNHGFMNGSSVTIAGATAIQGGDVSAALLNTTHLVSDVEIDSYVITIGNNGVSAMDENTYGGGANVTATENMFIDALIPYAEILRLPETSISVTYDSFSGRSQDGSQDIFAKSPLNRVLTQNRTNYLDQPIVIAGPSEHSAAGGGTTGQLDNSIATNKSFGITLTFTTTNTNLSPMLDGDRSSLFCISNRTNNVTTAAQKGSAQYNKTSHGRNYVADTAAKGNSNLNNYITRQITLANEATHLNFYADIFKPVGSDIILYYKAQSSGDDVPFDDLVWTELAPTVPIKADDTTFGEVEYGVKLSEIAEVTDTFSSFAFKVVMVTTNSARPPMFSNVRAIAST